MRRSFLEFVEAHVARIEPLETRAALAWWVASTTGDSEAFRLHESLRSEIESILADREGFALLSAVRDSGELRDPLEIRLAEVLYLDHLARQTSPDLLAEIVAKATRLEQTFNSFRPELDGAPVAANDLRAILAASSDSVACRRAWEASKAVGPAVAQGIRELARLRNRAAVDIGRANHWCLSMEVAELDPSRFQVLLDDLEEVTREPFLAIRREVDAGLASRFGLETAELRPWHFADPFFQEIPSFDGLDLDALYPDEEPTSVAARFFEGIGMPVDEVLRRSDVRERSGKSEHAFCVDIDRRGDVRVLLNARPGPRWTNATLHELGHAVYDLGISRDLPYPLRRPAHAFVTEAVAMLFGRLAEDGSWLKAMGLIAGADTGEIVRRLRRRRAAQHLAFARWCQVFLRFERHLYVDPDSDLEGLWWDLVGRYQYLPRPEGRTEPDWATKVHLVAAPVYYPNYVLGEVLAAQLERTLLGHLGADAAGKIVGRADVGAWMRDRLFRSGASSGWEETVVRSTGGSLDVRAFAEACQPFF